MMNPSSSGWIKKFFSLAGNLEDKLTDFPLDFSEGEFIYGNLQPTGIMYGFPTNFIFLPQEESEKWSGEEKFRVLLLEGLLISDYCHFKTFDLEHIEVNLERILRFYEETEIEKAKKSWMQFKDLDTYEKLESIIQQRVDIKMSLSNKLWTNYLQNSLIFQDLILYFEYCAGHELESLTLKRQTVMLDTLKVVAAAAHADGEIAEEEAALYDIFMASARLEGEDRDKAKAFWDEGKTLAEISFGYGMSWLLKRYLLEIATLMVWSDKVVVPEEQIFLDELSAKLGVDDEEQDKSFIAIQSFVLQNVESIPFLSGKNEAEQLMVGAANKWKKILSRNKDKLATELKQSKELVQLIAKSTTSDLSKEEKKKVKAQFKDMAKTIPSLTLFMLPGGSLIMPLVLKLIPDLVPSAFRSNQVEGEEEKLEE